MEFLLEILTEEMPAAHVKTGLSQLEEKLVQELKDADVDIYKIQTHGTCRRLVVVGNFASHQEDKEEDIIGPPFRIAFSADGKPSSAAKGFARAHDRNVDELQLIKSSKGEYLGLRKIEKGKPTRQVLVEAIPPIISSLSFPKMMRWGEVSFRFSRPIKNILCLFNREILSLFVGGISTSDYTLGHKIFSPKEIKARSYLDYKRSLKENKVVIEEDERRKIILNQMEKKLKPLQAQFLSDRKLMEKIVFDVESPYVFLGSFQKEYLKLPIEILSTALKEGQNLFSVVSGKKQLPYFLGVADNYKDPKSLIRKGNERVLIARLEDARFFWEQDLRIPLKKKANDLSRIIFQEKLGSYEDKIKRLKQIVSYLVYKVDEKKIKKEALQAAELSKADLLTEVVREFPSLQGLAGGLYAREEGYSSSVWKAIYEHYKPSSLEGDSPLSLTGAILSIADKLDSVVGTVGIGIEASGSKDPFGLRRNAHGVCKIILDRKLNFSFSRLLDKVIKIYGNSLSKSREDIKKYCLDFFSGRLQYMYEREGYRYDLAKAALSADADNIYYSSLRLKGLDNLKNSAHFEPMILIAKRVNNILRGQPSYRINPDLFYEKAEKELHTTFSIIKKNVLPLISTGDFLRAQRFIFRMRSTIDNFFDNVLVMTEDNRIRRNRLALLQGISKLLLEVADYSQVVVEGVSESETQDES